LPDLNPAQRAAVRCTDRPLLVLAGAGSGKTSVITEKIGHLLERGGLGPSQIAAVTFTNKAAREMRERVTKRMRGRDISGLRISTFHALGQRILREELETLGYRPGFSIYDGYDICQLLGDMLSCDASDPRCATLQQQISRAKNGGSAALAMLPSDMRTLLGEYERQMRARNAVDLDDLIALPTRLLAEEPQVRARWRDRIRYLLVDEYQDTNGRQYELVRLLVGEPPQFTVVGDDDQSIYAWRGAQPENLNQLARDFPALEVIKLEQNYRSTRRILTAANRLIRNNPHVYEKKLWSDLGLGDPIRVIRASDENDESRRVVAQILHHRLMQRTDYRDYAILYRGNHQSRPFEQALREHGIPYIVSGAISFFDYGEVRDTLAYMRLLANPSDDGALLRVINTPRREIGPTTVEKISTHARTAGVGLFEACWDESLHARLGARTTERLVQFVTQISRWAERAGHEAAVPLVKEMLEEVGYRRWIEAQADNPVEAERRNGNIDDLLAWMARLAGTVAEPRPLAEILSQLSLLEAMTERDGDDAADCVRLMTLHAAKGLEFPHVFLVGMEEEVLPHRSSLEADDVTEERRLAYVGITRARQTLTLTWAASRRRYGETRDTQISRFINELPADDLEWVGQASEARVSTDEGRQVLASLRNLLR
jgi:ATP-dependent DNA helicase Rep